MKTALVVVVVLLGAAAIGTLAFPALPCPDCGGASRAWTRPNPEAAVWIGCPRCLNRGKITAANRLRPRIFAAHVSRLFGGPGRVDFSEFTNAESRPVQAEGKSFVLALVRPAAMMIPGTCEVRMVLLDASGRRLDELGESTSTREGVLDLEFADPPPGDGTVAYVFKSEGQLSKVTRRVAIRGGRLMVLP